MSRTLLHLLNQVCKILMVIRWVQVVIDFGQELVTSVHRPVKWSNERPSEEEFKAVFAATRISAQRIMQFMGQRQHIVRRLVLLNGEGYWTGEACMAAWGLVLCNALR